MKTKYKNLAEFLEYKLCNEYTNIISTLNVNVFAKLDVKNNPCAERTLAFFSNNILEEYLHANHYDILMMSEVHIVPNIVLSNTTKSMYAKKTGLSKISIKNKYNGMMVPDTLISIKNNNETFNYFLEYKVHQNSFSYIKLAYDYLKYKIYTHNSLINTKFVYIIFNNGSKPTIVTEPNKLPKIQFIHDIINKKMIDKTANVFIYDSNIFHDIIEKKSVDKIVGIKELNKLENIINSINIIENNCSNITYENIEDISDNVYLKNLDALGKKVVTSKLMINHYELIKNIANNLCLNVNELINNINEIDNQKIKNEEQLYKWMRDYYYNFIKLMYNQDKPRVNEAISKIVKRKSMMFLILLKKFCEINGIEDFKIKFRNFKEENDYNNYRNNYFIKYFHTEAGYKEKFNALIKTILYYIINLYKVVYENDEGLIEIDDNNNACYNENYKIFLEKKKIIDSIASIKYLFLLNHKDKIEWQSDISELGESILKCLLTETLSLDQ